jgi:hypothetical protein
MGSEREDRTTPAPEDDERGRGADPFEGASAGDAAALIAALAAIERDADQQGFAREEEGSGAGE